MGEIIIPTRYKNKISQNLSYPVGAKEVSEALVSVPQFSELELRFFSYRFYPYWKRGNYEFLGVQFSTPVLHDGWSEWQIEVQPVPRVLRHRFHQYILEIALPQMAKWLVERAGAEQGQGVAFSYDEKSDEFITRSFESLQPLRI
jgi:hypothetical protein